MSDQQPPSQSPPPAASHPGASQAGPQAPSTNIDPRIAQAIRAAGQQKPDFENLANDAADEVLTAQQKIRDAQKAVREAQLEHKAALAKSTRAAAERAVNIKAIDDSIKALNDYLATGEGDLEALLAPVEHQEATSHPWHNKRFMESEYDSDYDEPYDGRLPSGYTDLFNESSPSSHKRGSGNGGNRGGTKRKKDSDSDSDDDQGGDGHKGRGTRATAIKENDQQGQPAGRVTRGQSAANNAADANSKDNAANQDDNGANDDNDDGDTTDSDSDSDTSMDDANTVGKNQKKTKKKKGKHTDTAWDYSAPIPFLTTCKVVVDLGGDNKAERYALLRCPVCHGNASFGTKDFMKGASGLRSHVKSIHSQQTNAKTAGKGLVPASMLETSVANIRQHYVRQYLSRREVSAIKRGKPPGIDKEWCVGGNDRGKSQMPVNPGRVIIFPKSRKNKTAEDKAGGSNENGEQEADKGQQGNGNEEVDGNGRGDGSQQEEGNQRRDGNVDDDPVDHPSPPKRPKLA